MNELLGKVPWVLLALIYVGYSGWEYYEFTSAPDSQFVIRQNEAATAKQQLSQLEAQVRDVRNFAKNLDAKRAEIKLAAAELDRIKTTLSDQMDIPSLIKLVLMEAKKAGLTVTSVNPTALVKKDYYAEQGFTVNFQGVYQQVLSFFDHQTSTDRIVLIGGFDMREHDPKQVWNTKYVEIEGTMQIKSYSYRGTKADDIATSKPGSPSRGAGT